MSLDVTATRARRPAGRPLDDQGRDRCREVIPLAFSLARRFAYLAPNRRDDLTGEALFAVVTAAGRFDPTLGIPWPPFAALCIRRRLVRITGADRDQAGQFAEGEDGPDASAEVRCYREPDPGRRVAAREMWLKLARALPYRLAIVLRLRYLNGANHQDIAVALRVPRDSARRMVDRALHRARLLIDLNVYDLDS